MRSAVLSFWWRHWRTLRDWLLHDLEDISWLLNEVLEPRGKTAEFEGCGKLTTNTTHGESFTFLINRTFFFSFTRRPLSLARSYTVQTVHSLNLVHLFINVFVQILYFLYHFRPTELVALVFGHLHSVLTGYLPDNSLSSVVRANKNLENFVVSRICHLYGSQIFLKAIRTLEK